MGVVTKPAKEVQKKIGGLQAFMCSRTRRLHRGGAEGAE
jgi:hypothetical protein